MRVQFGIGRSMNSTGTRIPRRTQTPSTLSAIRFGKSSGHLFTAWYVMPIATAASDAVPPNNLMAWIFNMHELNHSSDLNATTVQVETPTLSTMVDYWQRISDALKHANASQKQLQEALGISYQAMKKLEEGKTKSLSAENNARAARFLGVNSHWLATGEDTMLASNTPNQRLFQKAASTTCLTAQEPSAPPLSAWPFLELKPEQYAKLSERQKGIIEGFALALVKETPHTKSNGTRAA